MQCTQNWYQIKASIALNANALIVTRLTQARCSKRSFNICVESAESHNTRMTKVIAMKLHEHIRLIMADVWHAPHVAAVHGMHSTQFMHLPVGHFEGGVKSV